MLADLFFPPHCPFCGKVGYRLTCPACRENLPYAAGNADTRQGLHCRYALSYEGAVRDSLLRYKFHRQRGFAAAYAELVAELLKRDGLAEDTLLTWVPVSAQRKRERGYDQAYLLAEETARLFGREAVPTLEKRIDNPAQSSLAGAAERKKNVQNVYAVLSPERIAGKSFLLFDDIVTTGATLRAAADALLRAGARSVDGIALAGAGESAERRAEFSKGSGSHG